MNFTKIFPRYLCLVTAIAFAVSFCPSLGGQDPAESSAETKPAAQETPNASTQADATGEKTLDELLTQWSEMDKKLKEAESAARADGASEAAKITYKDMVDQAYKLIDQIQTSAVAAISKNAMDETAANTLLGIMLNGSLRTDGDKKVLALADTLINAGLSAELFEPAIKSNRLSPFGKDLFAEIMIRHQEHQADDLPRVKLTTTKGEIVVELFENEAPNTVANFISLTKAKFYDGLKFHRVIEGFVAQAGCPKGDGTGDPGYSIKCECFEKNARKHFTGSLSMAHGGRDTGGSQFFLTFRATSVLDGRHTVFGRAISGMDVLEQLTRNATDAGPIPGVEADKILKAEVVRDRGHEYKPAKVGDAAAAPEKSGN